MDSLEKKKSVREESELVSLLQTKANKISKVSNQHKISVFRSWKNFKRKFKSFTININVIQVMNWKISSIESTVLYMNEHVNLDEKTTPSMVNNIYRLVLILQCQHTPMSTWLSPVLRAILSVRPTLCFDSHRWAGNERRKHQLRLQAIHHRSLPLSIYILVLSLWRKSSFIHYVNQVHAHPKTWEKRNN